MPWWDIIKNDLFGAVLVAAALVALALIIKAVFAVYAKKRCGKNKEEQGEEPGGEAARCMQGELKLIDVDEKTAALIMAIVSHESGIPLQELDFHSIRNLGEAVGEES